MNDSASKTVLVVDNGQFVSVARRLGEQVGKCYYWSPSDRSLPLIQEAMIGDGFDEIERVESIWDVVDKVDFFVFPDIGHASLQKYLVSLGKPVWGARGGDVLESNRGLFLKTLESVGLEVPDHDVIKGLTNLRLFLKDKEDKYIKISKWRGNFETFHWVDWGSTESELDNLAVEFGPAKEMITFYVFDPIDTDIEDGCDAYCYDDQTEILTECGWIPFPEMRREYAVATLNPATGQIEYKIPSEVVKKRSDVICVCEKRKLNFAVTPKHGMVVKRHHSGDSLHRERLCDLSPGQQYAIPGSGVWVGSECHLHKIPKPTGIFRLRNGHNESDVSVKMDDWLEFLGWFIAEGSITRDGYTVGIGQAFIHDTEREKIRSVLSRLPFNFNENGINFRIHSKQLYLHLLASFRPGKRIPKYVKALSSRQIQICLDAIYLGDGTLCSNGSTKLYFAGPDRRLADDIQECLLKVGKCGAVHAKKPTAFGLIGSREVERTKTCFVVSEYSVSDRVLKPSEDIRTVPYAGFVYCVNVENHIIYVRRNGIPMWCGNCIDGNYPSLVLKGMEQKDKSFLGTMMKYDEMPEQLREVNDKFASALRQYDYRGFFSTEVRILPDKFYFIDPTCRSPSPPHQLQAAMWDNYADILWQGANGNCIDPEPNSKFGVQALLSVSRNEKEWAAVKIPDSIKDSVKCGFCCEIDGRLCFPPSPLESMAGYLTATGDTIEDAIASLQEKAKELPASMKCEDKSLAELLKQAQSAEDKGMEFTKDQDIPEPSIVLDD